MDLKATKKLLTELNISPLKSLGQNFLINEETENLLVQHIQKTPSPWVEIGPGLGVLTRHFSDKKDQLILIERDKKISEYWKKQEFTTYHEDALKFHWDKAKQVNTLFGNLPYQISARLVIQVTEQAPQIKQMIIMMQKEVARNMQALPKSENYGLISVIAQSFWNIKALLESPPAHFYPQPQVVGKTLLLERNDNSLDPKKFNSLVKKCFMHRRKKLSRKLPDWKNIEKKLKLSPSIRSEELAPSQFQEIYKLINP